MSRMMHVSMSVRGILSWPDKDIEERLGGSLKQNGVAVNKGTEIRKVLEEGLKAGWEWLPVGECDNFDPKNRL